MSFFATLTEKTGKMTLKQYARTWFANLKHSEIAAKNRIRALQSHDLIELLTTTIHPELEIEAPVLTWKQGEPPPNSEKVSWKLKSRWNLPPKRTQVILPTKKMAAVVGGDAIQPPRSRALLHDLHVTSIYLLLRKRDPELAESWVHESTLYQHGFGRGDLPLPDATIRLDTSIAIDFGGSYSAAKVRSLHAKYARHHMAYQLW